MEFLRRSVGLGAVSSSDAVPEKMLVPEKVGGSSYVKSGNVPNPRNDHLDVRHPDSSMFYEVSRVIA